MAVEIARVHGLIRSHLTDKDGDARFCSNMIYDQDMRGGGGAAGGVGGGMVAFGERCFPVVVSEKNAPYRFPSVFPCDLSSNRSWRLTSSPSANSSSTNSSDDFDAILDGHEESLAERIAHDMLDEDDESVSEAAIADAELSLNALQLRNDPLSDQGSDMAVGMMRAGMSANQASMLISPSGDETGEGWEVRLGNVVRNKGGSLSPFYSPRATSTTSPSPSPSAMANLNSRLEMNRPPPLQRALLQQQLQLSQQQQQQQQQLTQQISQQTTEFTTSPFMDQKHYHWKTRNGISQNVQVANCGQSQIMPKLLQRSVSTPFPTTKEQQSVAAMAAALSPRFLHQQHQQVLSSPQQSTSPSFPQQQQQQQQQQQPQTRRSWGGSSRAGKEDDKRQIAGANNQSRFQNRANLTPAGWARSQRQQQQQQQQLQVQPVRSAGQRGLVGHRSPRAVEANGQQQWPGSPTPINNGLRAVFLPGAGSCGRESSGGTGVFLPRCIGNNGTEFRRKTSKPNQRGVLNENVSAASSPVMHPSRLVQVMNMNAEDAYVGARSPQQSPQNAVNQIDYLSSPYNATRTSMGSMQPAVHLKRATSLDDPWGPVSGLLGTGVDMRQKIHAPSAFGLQKNHNHRSTPVSVSNVNSSANCSNSESCALDLPSEWTY